MLTLTFYSIHFDENQFNSARQSKEKWEYSEEDRTVNDKIFSI